MGLNGRQFFSVQKGVSQERLADLLVDAAHASLRMTQPYIFAVLVYDHDKELALKTAESIIASSSFGSRDILAARRLKEVALTALGRWDEAITEYKAAIALDPKDAHPHNGLGMVLPALGRRDEAITEYKAAIALDPKDASPHNRARRTGDPLPRCEARAGRLARSAPTGPLSVGHRRARPARRVSRASTALPGCAHLASPDQLNGVSGVSSG
jgi:tetratricopeptide (TPR) repeat protein